MMICFYFFFFKNRKSDVRTYTKMIASLRSPVSITVFSTPSSFSSLMAWALPSLRVSLITICPAYLPSMATWMMVPTWLQSCHWAPMLSIIFLLPTQTTLPFTLARIPCPAISSTSVTSQPSVASCGKAERRAAPIG